MRARVKLARRDGRMRPGVASSRAITFALGMIAVPALAGAQECSHGLPAFGSLGIGEFQCVGGSCSVNQRTGDPYAHSFSTEPRLRDIDPEGPGAAALREGDVLVAINGALITTAEGGRRLGSVRPGETVELTLRRGSREIAASVEARRSCALPRLEVSLDDRFRGPLAYTLATSDRAWALTTDSTHPTRIFADSLKVTWAPLRAATRYGAIAATGLAGRLAPRVEFGIELSCGSCGWVGDGGELAFRTDRFPVIETVERGGPADAAGVQPGDVLLTVQGVPVTTREAGLRLGSLEAGEPVELEVRRADRIVRVRVTPRDATARRQRL